MLVLRLSHTGTQTLVRSFWDHFESSHWLSDGNKLPVNIFFFFCMDILPNILLLFQNRKIPSDVSCLCFGKAEELPCFSGETSSCIYICSWSWQQNCRSSKATTQQGSQGQVLTLASSQGCKMTVNTASFCSIIFSFQTFRLKSKWLKCLDKCFSVSFLSRAVLGEALSLLLTPVVEM